MFLPLNEAEIEQIVKLQLAKVNELLAKNDTSIDVTQEALAHIAQIGFDPQFGARPIKRIIQKEILSHLSRAILSGIVNTGGKIRIDYHNGFTFSNEPAV